MSRSSGSTDTSATTHPSPVYRPRTRAVLRPGCALHRRNDAAVPSSTFTRRDFDTPSGSGAKWGTQRHSVCLGVHLCGPKSLVNTSSAKEPSFDEVVRATGRDEREHCLDDDRLPATEVQQPLYEWSCREVPQVERVRDDPDRDEPASSQRPPQQRHLPDDARVDEQGCSNGE